MGTPVPDSFEERQFLAIIAVIFIVVLTGCSALPGSFDGRGELTVSVVDKQGNPVEKQTVSIRNTETSQAVFEGSTGPDGKVSTTLEQGNYVVAAEDTTHTVKIDEGTESITLSVAPTPPKPDESGTAFCCRRILLTTSNAVRAVLTPDCLTLRAASSV